MQHFANLSYKKFKKIQNMYWVLSKEGQKANHYNWVFSKEKPEQVTDSVYIWRRPTYREAVERQIAYDSDPDKFIKECQKFIEKKHDKDKLPIVLR